MYVKYVCMYVYKVGIFSQIEWNQNPGFLIPC